MVPNLLIFVTKNYRSLDLDTECHTECHTEPLISFISGPRCCLNWGLIALQLGCAGILVIHYLAAVL